MKKILVVLFFGLISITANSSVMYAENSIGPAAFDDLTIYGSTIRNIMAVEHFNYSAKDELDIKDIHTRAIKDFQNRFNHVNNAVWYSLNNGFVSYFLLDGYGERVFYDKKGHWQFSLLLYGEGKLPRDVRASVKSVYFDLAITQVEEVQTPNGFVYIVNLEDKSSIKVLKVNRDGEMFTLLDLVKE
jgi:hypothetical protein